MVNAVISMFKNKGRQFVMGLCVGLSISLFLQTYRHFAVKEALRRSAAISLETSRWSGQIVRGYMNTQPSEEQDNTPPGWMNSVSLHSDGESDGEAVEHKFEDEHVHQDDDTIAKDLYKRVRVLCWVMTAPKNLDKKTIHVKKTWAKRCNVVLYMSSVTNSSFPTVGLNVSEGRQHLTAKTMEAFKYIYENHFDDAEWFMKADDDTYVILENLRYFLSDEDPGQPVYFGQKFKTIVKQGYSSGGSGYVLSKEALRRFAQVGSHDPHLCAKDGGAEDVQMGRCMQNLGVALKPSTDILKRTRFHCFNAETVINNRFPRWFHQYDSLGGKGGLENISDYAISFHYVSPEKMYFLEFYTYHLQAYGILHKPQKLNRK